MGNVMCNAVFDLQLQQVPVDAKGSRHGGCTLGAGHQMQCTLVVPIAALSSICTTHHNPSSTALAVPDGKSAVTVTVTVTVVKLVVSGPT